MICYHFFLLKKKRCKDNLCVNGEPGAGTTSWPEANCDFLESLTLLTVLFLPFGQNQASYFPLFPEFVVN